MPGTIAWFQPSMEELAAKSGAQGSTICPACNGASVQVGRTATYRKDGKKAWTKSSATIFLVGGGILLLLCVVLGVGLLAMGGEGATQLYQWTNGKPSFVPDWMTPDQFIGFWMLVVALVFFAGPAARGAMLLSNYAAKVKTTYNFTCRGCKNKWSVEEVAPSAAPNLILLILGGVGAVVVVALVAAFLATSNSNKTTSGSTGAVTTGSPAATSSQIGVVVQGRGGQWTAVATKVDAAAGGLHVDITIRNDTGAWSAMQAVPSQAAVLATGDGKSTSCATVFVGTGGTPLAPGFQVRGYTGGTEATPATQLLYVECAGATPAPGAKLSIAYSYTTGEFNYYSPSAATSAKLAVDLDKVTADLTYPVAASVEGVIEKADTKIIAINNCTLVLTSAKRTADGLELGWQTENPTAYPTYVHIGTPPVVGSDGVIYGYYESPHLATTPITPAGQTAQWTTRVTVPKDVTGLFILLSVESKQVKNFVSHAVDITDK